MKIIILSIAISVLVAQDSTFNNKIGIGFEFHTFPASIVLVGSLSNFKLPTSIISCE